MKLKSILQSVSAIVFSLYFCSFKASATIHLVTVSNFQFTPASIPDVLVGDTIQWNWEAGSFNHTTTCDPGSQGAGNSLPAGAATWNSPMTAANPTFQYKVTVAGLYNYWCIPHSPAMAASFTASNPLPVSLAEFKVSNVNNNALLNWTTASEENIDHFSIQKSKTGADFTEIGRVPASGNSSQLKAYSFTDPNPSVEDKYVYYNIAVVDKNGKQEFSPVKLFKNTGNIPKLVISLSPNPVSQSGHLMLKFNADRTSKMNVTIVDLGGKSVMKTTMQAVEGVNNGHIMLGAIPAGSYSVSFELNGLKEVYKLVVK